MSHNASIEIIFSLQLIETYFQQVLQFATIVSESGLIYMFRFSRLESII